MTKEQKFLLDNKCDDLCLNRAKVDYHGDKRGYKYVSDVMESYLMSARQNTMEPPVNNTQQLKAAIALVKDAGASCLDGAILYDDLCRHLDTIKQRAAV